VSWQYLDWFLLGWLVATLGAPAATVFFAHRYLRGRHRYQPPYQVAPPISIVKPLRGASHNLLNNLEGTFRTRYAGPLELVCVIETPDDEAGVVVRELQARHPDQQIRLVVSHGRASIFGKHANLIAGYEAASHEIVVFSDADVRIEPGLLEEMIPPLLHPEIGGSTTGFYQDFRRDLPTALMSMFVNTFAWVPNLAIRQVNGLRWCVGGLMAFRKPVLERMGGLAAIIADKISDDAALGKCLHDHGYSIYLCGEPYHVIRKEPSVSAIFFNIHRWMLMYRTQDWDEYLNVLKVNSVFPLLIWWLAAALGHTPVALVASLSALVLVWEVLWGMVAIDQFCPAPRNIWLRYAGRPVGLLLLAAAWIWGLLWPFTVWGGRLYRVFYEGGAELVGVVEPPPEVAGSRLRRTWSQGKAKGREAVRLLRLRLSG